MTHAHQTPSRFRTKGVSQLVVIFTSSIGHPHHHKAKGRLQMKVYRGPKDGHHFAPWGYWLKHPEDDKHHGKY